MPLDEFHDWVEFFEIKNEQQEKAKQEASTSSRPSMGKTTMGRKSKSPVGTTVVTDKSPVPSAIPGPKQYKNGREVAFYGTVGS